MRGDAEDGGRSATHQRAAEAAEAEPGVQPRQQRPAGAGLDLDADGVRGDVDHPGGGAEHEQHGAQRRDRRHEAGQGGGQRDQRPRRRPRPGRTEAGAQRAGHAHADERAERQAQQRDAEGGVAGADGGGHVGHAGRPAAEDGAVEHEEGGDGGAEPGRRRRGAVGSRREPERPAGHRLPDAQGLGKGGHGRTSRGGRPPPAMGWPRRAGRAHDLGHPRSTVPAEPDRCVSNTYRSGVRVPTPDRCVFLRCCASAPRWRCPAASTRRRCPSSAARRRRRSRAAAAAARPGSRTRPAPAGTRR